MVNGAFAIGPGALRQIGLMLEVDDCARATIAYFIAAEGAIGVLQFAAPAVVHELG
ncbi:hypothetical protein D3C84_1214490 [compost metagenome]